MGSWLSGSPGSRAVWARLRRLVPSPPHTGVRPASAQPRPEHPSLPAPSTGVSPEESPAGPRTYTDSRLSPAAPLHGTPVPQGPTPPHRGSSRPRHLGSSLPGRAGRVPSGLLWQEPQRKWLLSLPSHPHTSFSFGRLPPHHRSPLAQVPVELPTSPSTSPCSKSGQSPRRETPRDCDGPAATVPQSLGTRCWRGLCPGALLLTRGARASGAPAFPDTR